MEEDPAAVGGDVELVLGVNNWGRLAAWQKLVGTLVALMVFVVMVKEGVWPAVAWI